VKKRFINMRDTFMDNLRKIKESIQRASGKGADEINQSGHYIIVYYFSKKQ